MTTLNFNIGVLGHVDSGKTSLAKALSTIASTACFDKNPQSKERGITLDLGFSSFTVESPDSLKQKGYDYVQYTLVDCPGHASLIKTIIGGAQIIDMMILVIDIQKGIQTQTAECLIIGEICCNKMLIVLNKLDLIDESKRDSVVDKMTKRLHKTLENTKFANSEVIAVAASNQNQTCTDDCEKENLNEKLESLSLKNNKNMINIDLLIDKLKNMTFLPERNNENGPFLYSVDHCFTIKGQGTVLTGTVLNGNVKINDTIEIPILKAQKKVKSIQVFRKPVEKAIQGDRCGICIANFDSKLFERGVVCSPNFLKYSYGVIISLSKIKHFKGSVESGSKFHISIGHETLLGKLELFGELDNEKNNSNENNNLGFDFSKEYVYVHDMNPTETDNSNKQNNHKIKQYFALIDFNYENHKQNTEHSATGGGVLCSLKSLLIGSKLDTDIHLNQCRIAFSGQVLHQFLNKDYRESNNSSNQSTVGNHLADLKVYKEKLKEGLVERKHDEMTLIGRSLFKKETNMDLFVGLKVSLSTGEQGIIEGSFGQSGKFRIRIPNGLSQSTKEQLDVKSNKNKKQHDESSSSSSSDHANANNSNPIKIYLNYKRFIYDDKKKLIQ